MSGFGEVASAVELYRSHGVNTIALLSVIVVFYQRLRSLNPFSWVF